MKHILKKYTHGTRVFISKLVWRDWFIFLVVLAITLPWFFQSGFLFFTDLSWGPHISVDWQMSQAPFQMIFRLLAFVFPSSLVEKLFIAGIFGLILYGGWFLTHAAFRWFSNTFSSYWFFPVSLFALFNPFVYDRALYGQFFLLAGYACLLFVVGFLSEFIRIQKRKSLFLAVFLSGIAVMCSPHFFFLILPFFVMMFVLLLMNRINLDWRMIRKEALIACLVLLFLNSVWIITFLHPDSYFLLSTQGIDRTDFLAFQTVGHSNWEALRNILFMSGFWGKDQFRYADLTDIAGWQRSLLFIFFVLLFGGWMVWKNKGDEVKKFAVGLFVIFIVAIFLALGLRTGFLSPLSQFVFELIPFYAGMREPQKWVSVLIPIYLFFFSWGVVFLQTKKLIVDNQKLVIVILSLIVIAQAPLLLFGFHGQARAMKYPADWKEMNQILIDRSGTGRCEATAVFLPWHLYLSFPWTGKVIANPAKNAFSCPMISGANMEFGGINDQSRMNEQQLAVQTWVEKNGRRPSDGSLPFRYVLLAKTVDWKNYSWLDHLPNGAVLIKETENFRLYEFQP